MYLLHRLLTRIVRAGEFTVIAHDGTARSYGAVDPARAPVVIRLTDSRVPLAILTHGDERRRRATDTTQADQRVPEPAE